MLSKRLTQAGYEAGAYDAFCRRALFLPEVIGKEEKAPSAEQMAVDAAINNLKNKTDEELYAYLKVSFLGLGNLILSDAQIESLKTALKHIQDNDRYSKNHFGKAGTMTLYPNRYQAKMLILNFDSKLRSDKLRALPLNQRMAKVLAGIETSDTVSYGYELEAVGNKAIPYVLKHDIAQPYHRRTVVKALAKIGDERAVDYIVASLKKEGDRNEYLRVEAAKALAHFKSQKSIDALINALNDDAIQVIDRRAPQLATKSSPWLANYFLVRHAAAQSLSKITGKNWGHLFNEDFITWNKWSKSGKSVSFEPAGINRTSTEWRKLISSLFDRRLSGRPNPYQSKNLLADRTGINAIAKDLDPQKTIVIPILNTELQTRNKKTPIWQKEVTAFVKAIKTQLR